MEAVLLISSRESCRQQCIKALYCGGHPQDSIIVFPSSMPIPPQSSSAGSATVIRRHPEYFFPEGDVTFRVENTAFRVHKRFFFRESSYFQSLFSAPPIPCTDPPGSSETNPVVLKDLTSDAFAHLLWVFYNPKYSIYNTTLENWVQILVLAQRWAFKEVEELCIRELENLVIMPVAKICIYQEFKLNRALLRDSFTKLTIRDDPLSLEEGEKLGLETALQIARARERSRGSNSGARPLQLRDSEIHSILRDAFGLKDDGFDFEPHPPANDSSTRKNAKKATQ